MISYTIRWSGSANCYVGECPQLEIMSQGETPSQALTAVQGAVKMWMKAILERDNGVFK